MTIISTVATKHVSDGSHVLWWERQSARHMTSLYPYPEISSSSIPACIPCFKRHQKCDNSRMMPCSRCLRQGRANECIPNPNKRGRPSKYVKKGSVSYTFPIREARILLKMRQNSTHPCFSNYPDNSIVMRCLQYGQAEQYISNLIMRGCNEKNKLYKCPYTGKLVVLPWEAYILLQMKNKHGVTHHKVYQGF